MTDEHLTLERAARWALRVLVVAVAVVLVAMAFSRLRILFLPVIIALLLATVVVPVVDRLDRAGLPRILATWVVLLTGIASLVGIGWLLAPSVAEQFADLGPTLQEGREEVESWLINGPADLSQREIDRYTEQALGALRSSGGQIAGGLMAGAIVAAEVVAGLALTVVLLFFFVKDGGKMTAFVLRQVRPEHRELAGALGHRAWAAAFGYVRGTAIVATVDATLIGLGLAVIGTPLVLPLALLTFIGGFFPLVGATAAGIVAALVALVSGGVSEALLVGGLVIVVQQVEGDVLAPVVLGRAVRLHPVVVLAVLTAGAVLGGIVGAFLAVPVTAVGVAVGSELRARGIIGPPGETAAPDEQAENGTSASPDERGAGRAA